MTSIFSIALAAVSSSTAATARIGSPSYSGSLVRPRSLNALAMIPSPRFAPATTGGRSSTVSTAFTPSIASARLASMRVTRACGMGLRSSFANSIPSAR